MFKAKNIQIWLRSSVFIYYLKHIEYDNLEIYIAFGHVIDAFNAQQTKFYIYFFNKWEKNPVFMRICSHLLKKTLMENFIFWVMQEAVTLI